jgi:hypothetical protein
MAQLIRIRQDLIVSTDEITVAGLAFVELRDGRSFLIVPAVWNALQEVALPERGVDVTPYEEREGMSVPTIGGIAQTSSHTQLDGMGPMAFQQVSRKDKPGAK